MHRFDVTLSVWNQLHSLEQCEGFKRANLRTYWLGNRQRPKSISSGRRDFHSVAWLYAASYLKLPFELCRQMSMASFDWFAGLHPINSPVLWAYAPMNTRLVQKANQQGIPVILDVAIGHQRLFLEIMSEESIKLGLPFSHKLFEHGVRKYEWEYKNSDWLSVGSSFVKKTLIERGINADKILVNSYGVDASRWLEANSMRKFNRSKMTFVYVAAITPRKGIHYLVDAWKRASLKDAELIVAGGQRAALEKLCGPLPDSIITPGRLTHPQMIELYANSDVYVLPSLLEGLARSGLEAMASGLPLLITEETGLTDFVKNGKEGWIVPSRDVQALTEQLRWCYEHPSKVEEAGKNSFKVGQNQTFEAYGDRCAAIVKVLINGGDVRTVRGIKL